MPSTGLSTDAIIGPAEDSGPVHADMGWFQDFILKISFGSTYPCNVPDGIPSKSNEFFLIPNERRNRELKRIIH